MNPPIANWDGQRVWVIGASTGIGADSFGLKAANAMLDLKLRGRFNCLGAVLPLPLLLGQDGGGIGIAGSVSGYGGLPKALVYGPTKPALIILIHFPRRFTNAMRLARLLPYRLYFWLIHKVTKP